MKDTRITLDNKNVDLQAHINDLSPEAKNELIKLAVESQIKLNSKIQEDIVKTQNADGDFERHMDAAQRIQYQSSKGSIHRVKTDIDTPAGHMHLESNTSKCYVATATYQNINHPNVILLRSYRDKILRQSFCGRCFISLYYTIGKYLAFFPEHSFRIRYVSKKLIDAFVQHIRKKYNI